MKVIYESPTVEVVDAEVEHGFALSAGMGLGQMEDDGDAFGDLIPMG